MTDSAIFVNELVRAVPVLTAALDEHLSDHRTLLPHVFMGDVTRFAINAASNPELRSSVQRLLDHLDEGLRSGSDEVRELIGASFVENLIGETTALCALRPLMKPALKAEAAATCG